MFSKIGFAILMAVLFVTTTPLLAQESALSMADARSALAGKWRGKLEYRDYQAERWFGIPTTVEIEQVDNGVTIIRKAAYDDGASGTVTITVVSMLAPDGKTEYVGSFRADRPAELSQYSLRFSAGTVVEEHGERQWTVVAKTEGRDDNRPAMIRETTTRAGHTLLTLKEVNYLDDGGDLWLVRNRLVLEKTE